MKPITEKPDGSPIPRLEAKGKGTAGTAIEQPTIKKCPHPYCGCISHGRANACLLNGPCDPCDDQGRRFTVLYERIQGQLLSYRQFHDGKSPSPPIFTGNKAVCGDRCMCQPENHPEGKGACGKKIAPIIVGS